LDNPLFHAAIVPGLLRRLHFRRIGAKTILRVNCRGWNGRRHQAFESCNGWPQAFANTCARNQCGFIPRRARQECQVTIPIEPAITTAKLNEANPSWQNHFHDGILRPKKIDHEK
jgi:hypothetical protein